jgi:hypothetical protein
VNRGVAWRRCFFCAAPRYVTFVLCPGSDGLGWQMADGRWQIYGNYTFYGFYVKQKAEIGKAETTPHVVAYNEKG